MDTDGSKKTNPDSLKQAKEAVTERVKSAIVPIHRTIGKHLLLKMLVLAVIALIALHFLSVITIPFPPFTTKGKIYVDSPEVYTRERLVNDRYNQDYWLRKQLEKLDNLDIQLVREQRSTTLDVQIAKSDMLESPAESVGSSGRNQLTFDQEFRVVTGIRDMIRQLILENMLDDRHDLTGNSVYGLKFDTTVIPGANTRLRAYVHVNLTIDKLFNTKCKASGCFLGHIDGYVLSRLKNAGRKKDGDENVKKATDHYQKQVDAYRKQYKNYLNWLEDISKRLNRTEDSVFESMESKCPLSEKKHSFYDELSEAGRGLAFYNELTRRTLEIVLGVPPERFTDLNKEGSGKLPKRLPGWVALPPPWGNFFQISRTSVNFISEDKDGANICNYRVWFDVDEVVESFVVYKGSASTYPYLCEKKKLEKDAKQDKTSGILAPQAGSQETQEQSGDDVAALAGRCATDEKQVALIPIGAVEDNNWKLYVDPWLEEMRSKIYGAEYIEPKYELASATVDKLLDIREGDCKYGYADPASCLELNGIDTISVPSGFFNFAEHLSALDAYSYAIFPKNDVVGILAETNSRMSGGASGAGFLGVVTGLSESRTASVLVGYGDGAGSNPGIKGEKGDDTIAFGWVISARGDMEPTMKNQLALVSVPAWTDKLHLTIHVGWLDRESNQVITDEEDSFEITISLPPDFEAFDSIFKKEAWVTHGPRIQDDAMDKDIYVRSGKKVKILIPGSRLWRSATVTLGAQQAERIRVLPNMEGIIAEFDEIDLPHAAYNAEKNQKRGSQGTAKYDKCGMGFKEKLDSRPVSLRVWTSEGVAKASRPVCVFFDLAKVESGESQARRKSPAIEVSEPGGE